MSRDTARHVRSYTSRIINSYRKIIAWIRRRGHGTTPIQHRHAPIRFATKIDASALLITFFYKTRTQEAVKCTIQDGGRVWTKQWKKNVSKPRATLRSRD